MQLIYSTRVLLTTGLTAFALVAGAQAVADDSGWYGGVSIGRSTAEIDRQRITESLVDAGFAVTSFSENDSDTGYKFFGGYQISRHFALEAGYFDLGEFGYTANFTPEGTLSGDIGVSGLNFDVVGILPFTGNFSMLGRIGAVYAEAEDSFSGTGSAVMLDSTRSESDTNYKYGLGLQYDFTESFGMRAEMERYRIDDAINNKGDVDLMSLGVVYRFGGRTHQVAPVAATAPVPTRQYCSVLDIQYEINQDDIQRAEEEKLGVVATFLQKYPDTTAVIEGHTDNIGTAEDNMTLSKSRAESVVNYLVATHRIARSRLSAVGYGDTRPMYDNATEKGKRLNRRIGTVIPCATDIEGLKPIPARVTMAMDMEFGPNKTAVRSEYREELRKVANYLKANPTVTATVEGHTGDLQATPKLAMEISRERAQNVVDYLVDNFNVPRSGLAIEGFGETRHVAYGTSAAGQQDNRRINIILNYPNT